MQIYLHFLCILGHFAYFCAIFILFYEKNHFNTNIYEALITNTPKSSNNLKFNNTFIFLAFNYLCVFIMSSFFSFNYCS